MLLQFLRAQRGRWFKMPVAIKGSGGGSVTLDAGAASADTTLTIPNVTGTVLQSGTAVTVAQGGTGATTLTANNVLLGNGTSAVQVVAPGTTGNVLTSNGTTWTSTAPTGGAINVQTFTSSGTWTKPAGYAAGSRVLVQCWGGGGSGGKTTNASGASGGGAGGGYNERWLSLSQMGATETATVGAGGTAASAAGNGNVGGTTSLGTLAYAYGGGGGGGSATASFSLNGSGGGQLSAGATGSTLPGKPFFVADGPNGQFQGSGGYGSNLANVSGVGFALYHGGGGAYALVYGIADNSVWGGGGGGASATNTAGGTSQYAGNGGAGGATGTAGTQPAGGGGGSTPGNSGAGGAGQIIVTVFPA